MNSTTRLTRGYLKATAFLVLFLMAGCSEGREPELYLIPEGYVGSFHIVFNIPSGKPQTYENGARVYDIPEDGVLLIQSNSNPGSISGDKINFYYESEDGNRRQIKGRWTTSLHDTPENRSDDQVYIFGGGIGLIEPVRHCQIYTSDYYVGTKSQALDNVGHFDIYSDQGIDNLPDEIFLEACNNK